eukprot:scaffold12476_cov110-Skeletonema_dohrnii-CCMP3373.AAC.1
MLVRGRRTHNQPPPRERPMSARSRKRAMMKCMLSTALLHEVLVMHDKDANTLMKTLLSFKEKQKVRSIKKKAAKKRRFRLRRSWAAFDANLTERQFRRYFRMSRECFRHLCSRIEENVGESVFKSEKYLIGRCGGHRLHNKVVVMMCFHQHACDFEDDLTHDAYNNLDEHVNVLGIAYLPVVPSPTLNFSGSCARHRLTC